jgi:hypothetical protein
MNDLVLTPLKLAFVVATRAALALGVGLLISEKLREAQRRNAGRALIAIGALTTIPALMLVARSKRIDLNSVRSRSRTGAELRS